MLTERLEMNNVVRPKPNVSEIMPVLFKQHHRYLDLDALANKATTSKLSKCYFYICKLSN